MQVDSLFVNRSGLFFGTIWTNKVKLSSVIQLGDTLYDGGSITFDVPHNKPVFFINAHSHNLGLYIIGNTDNVAYNWKTILSSEGIIISNSGHTFTIKSQSGTACRGFAFYLDM